MIKRAFVTAALLALAAASFPVQAQPQHQAAPTTQNERRICRSVNRVGSRLTRTVTCKTQAEWDEHAAEARRTADRIQRVPSTCLMGPGGTVICSSAGP